MRHQQSSEVPASCGGKRNVCFKTWNSPPRTHLILLPGRYQQLGVLQNHDQLLIHYVASACLEALKVPFLLLQGQPCLC